MIKKVLIAVLFSISCAACADNNAFRVDYNRLKAVTQGNLFFTAEQIKSIVDNADKPEFKHLFEKAAKVQAKVLKIREIPTRSPKNPYIYRAGSLTGLSLVYMLSGNSEYGKILKERCVWLAKQSPEFWIHAELRRFDPKAPVGQLETAMLISAMSATLDLVRPEFSEEEYREVKEALHEKGYIPCIRWLKNPMYNNFAAVLSSNTYVTAKFFKDQEGMALAKQVMKTYLENTIEDDGSYSEQVDYFDFPISNLLKAFVAMGMDQTKALVEKSGLKGSLNWLPYYYLYLNDGKSMKKGKIVFGDGDTYSNASSPQRKNIYMSHLFQNGVGLWLKNQYCATPTPVGFGPSFLVEVACLGSNLKPVSPEEAGLPLVKTFENGVGFIRSSWKPNSTVLAIRSGGIGKTRGSHDRPNRNSFALAALGEYLIVSPGRASYRSKIHSSYDRKTHSANTITIDGQNQIFPRFSWKPKGVGKEVKQPKAEFVASGSSKHFDYLVSEAKDAYPQKLNMARRAALFFRQKEYIVVIDRMVSGDDPHSYSWHVHFNNHDQKGELKETAKGAYLFARPKANLVMNQFADAELTYETKPGYMHLAYSYYPKSKNEGKLGSSYWLEGKTGKTKEVTFVTVLQPYAGSNAPREVSYCDGVLLIGVDEITIADGVVTAFGDTESGTLKLW